MTALLAVCADGEGCVGFALLQPCAGDGAAADVDPEAWAGDAACDAGACVWVWAGEGKGCCDAWRAAPGGDDMLGAPG